MKHVISIAALAAVAVLLSILPFLSGDHFDGVLALALLAHVLGVAGVICVPSGIAWLSYRHARGRRFSAVPLYLVVVPSAALIAQLALATPLTERSRAIAIQNSADMIRDIEAYHAEHGHYPASLFAVYPDYSPGIFGVPQYHYEPNGEAYNLTFEQPRFLLDDFGAREFVMYNPRDEHALTSHAVWRLSHPKMQGWYAVQDTGVPHWKYFLFD